MSVRSKVKCTVSSYVWEHFVTCRVDAVAEIFGYRPRASYLLTHKNIFTAETLSAVIRYEIQTLSVRRYSRMSNHYGAVFECGNYPRFCPLATAAVRGHNRCAASVFAFCHRAGEKYCSTIGGERTDSVVFRYVQLFEVRRLLPSVGFVFLGNVHIEVEFACYVALFLLFGDVSIGCEYERFACRPYERR